MPDPRCGREFFAGDAQKLAVRLLGQRLVRVFDDGMRVAGIIVETEAYLGVMDRAAHCFGGRRTARNEAMYGPPGMVYVYFTYGMHWCVNTVCGSEGEPTAVLIRALEPTEGLDEMRRRRGLGQSAREISLCSGPARLCQALGIDRGLNGADLHEDSRLFVERVRHTVIGKARLRNTPRVGVGYAGAWAGRRLRWFVAGNPHVSPGGVSRIRNMKPGADERGLVGASGRATVPGRGVPLVPARRRLGP